jgi:hypothetical protein
MKRNLQVLIPVVILVLVAVIAVVVTTTRQNPNVTDTEKAAQDAQKAEKDRAGLSMISGRPGEGGPGSRPGSHPLNPVVSGGQNAGPSVVGASGAVSLSSLRAAIFGTDAAAREQALQELAKLLQNGQGHDLVKEMMQSNNRELIAQAQALIPNMEENERMDLMYMGLESPFKEARLETLLLARDIATQDVNKLISMGLSDQDSEVVEETTDLFNYFSDFPIYDAAKQGIESENQQVRDGAMSYLEDTHTSKSVMLLVEALGSKYSDISSKAGDALRFITDAEIESNDYKAWKAWWDKNGAKWAEQYSDDDDEQKMLDLMEENK